MRNKIPAFSVGLLLLLLVGLLAWISTVRTPVRKCVLAIGIDGLRPDALAAAETPHLDRLISAGAYFENTQILGDRYAESDTISGPGWSSILTGVWADKHGVHDNSFEGADYEGYPHFFVRLKEQRPDTRTASFVDWVPIDDHIVAAADIAEQVEPVDGDYPGADRTIADRASVCLREESLDAVFVYFGQVDEAGHAHGFHPTVGEYIQAVERVDGHVGELMKAIDQRAGRKNEDWLTLVTTDHGGSGTGHGGGHDDQDIRNVFLIVSGAAAKAGRFDSATYLVDFPVTALAHLKIHPDNSWGLDGRPVGLREPGASEPQPR